jgi:DnaJ like chaperone protein
MGYFLGFGGLILGFMIAVVVNAYNISRFIKAKPLSDDFIVCLFTLFAKVAKSDGHVDTSEAETVKAILNRIGMNLTPDKRVLAIETFNSAIKEVNDIPLSQIVERLLETREFMVSDHSMYIIIFESCVAVTASDGVLDAREKELLDELSTYFNIHPFIYRTLMAKYFGNYDGGNTGGSGSSYNSYSSRMSNNEKSISEYYKLLNCSVGDDLATVKTNYKKLVSEYHPDKLASKGLPKEIVAMSENKLKEINEAYKIVRKHLKK